MVFEILNTIINDNFKISRRKTNYDGEQTVTGIKVLLNKIDAPQKIVDKAKLEADTNAEIKPYTNYLNSIRKTLCRRVSSLPKKNIKFKVTQEGLVDIQKILQNTKERVPPEIH